ncbi:hypothetical protein Deipe_4450 (plasmid) [Deinococcus peraridilitoris DSM 19664]|uniref:Uncharacterized protein n=1 Tax=Deinococcus peraridilitoris (strain DSM 19664 / LMG 22246 / CIP 109416 / KR-200) TaxID=937777 RepID=L0A7D5_DEIPD|nr:hypothetical protein Deipe_4450 [Deinococcus peraridilitoris DSM 19664]
MMHSGDEFYGDEVTSGPDLEGLHGLDWNEAADYTHEFGSSPRHARGGLRGACAPEERHRARPEHHRAPRGGKRPVVCRPLSSPGPQTE